MVSGRLVLVSGWTQTRRVSTGLVTAETMMKLICVLSMMMEVMVTGISGVKTQG